MLKQMFNGLLHFIDREGVVYDIVHRSVLCIDNKHK